MFNPFPGSHSFNLPRCQNAAFIATRLLLGPAFYDFKSEAIDLVNHVTEIFAKVSETLGFVDVVKHPQLPNSVSMDQALMKQRLYPWAERSETYHSHRCLKTVWAMSAAVDWRNYKTLTVRHR